HLHHRMNERSTDMNDRTPSVLFVCVHNAGRSQMAAGWLRHLAGDRIEVRSAGSMPVEQINPVAVEAMLEVGIDITAEQPKVLTAEAVQDSDVVITMGCGDACPYFPGKRYEDWELDDPAGQGIEAVRPIRDEIRSRIETLTAELLGQDPARACVSSSSSEEARPVSPRDISSAAPAWTSSSSTTRNSREEPGNTAGSRCECSPRPSTAPCPVGRCPPRSARRSPPPTTSWTTSNDTRNATSCLCIGRSASPASAGRMIVGSWTRTQALSMPLW